MIALAVLLTVQIADAQVKSPEAAKKALAGAEAAAENPKKAVKVATWMNLAKAYMDAYNRICMGWCFNAGTSAPHGK